jgi:hypothetical protein
MNVLQTKYLFESFEVHDGGKMLIEM